jgi:hypothetical protein
MLLYFCNDIDRRGNVEPGTGDSNGVMYLGLLPFRELDIDCGANDL